MASTNTETAPDWITLTETEEVHWVGRSSAWTLLSTVLTSIILVAAGIVGTAYLVTVDLGESTPPIAGYAPLLVSLFGLLSLLIGYLRWRFNRYAITSEEIYHRWGIINKNMNQMRIHRVQNTSFNQGIIERVFSYGDITIFTAGTDDFDFIFRNIPNPQTVNQKLTRLNGEAEKRVAGGPTGSGMNEPAGGAQ